MRVLHMVLDSNINNSVCVCACCVLKVCDLLDLLSGPDEPTLPGSTLGSGGGTLGGLAGPGSSGGGGSAGGDLLDLLGGLELTPTPAALTGKAVSWNVSLTRS